MASSSSKVSDLFDELEELHLQSLTWEPDSVNIVVAKSYESRDDSECVTIDLLKTLETGKRCPKPNQRNNTNVYYLPPSFNVNTAEFRKEVLSNHFVLPCRAAGFVLVILQWEEKKSYVSFGCHRYKPYKRNDKAATPECQDLPCSEDASPNACESSAIAPPETYAFDQLETYDQQTMYENIESAMDESGEVNLEAMIANQEYRKGPPRRADTKKPYRKSRKQMLSNNTHTERNAVSSLPYNTVTSVCLFVLLYYYSSMILQVPYSSLQ